MRFAESFASTGHTASPSEARTPTSPHRPSRSARRCNTPTRPPQDPALQNRPLRPRCTFCPRRGCRTRKTPLRRRSAARRLGYHHDAFALASPPLKTKTPMSVSAKSSRDEGVQALAAEGRGPPLRKFWIDVERRGRGQHKVAIADLPRRPGRHVEENHVGRRGRSGSHRLAAVLTPWCSASGVGGVVEQRGKRAESGRRVARAPRKSRASPPMSTVHGAAADRHRFDESQRSPPAPRAVPPSSSSPARAALRSIWTDDLVLHACGGGDGAPSPARTPVPLRGRRRRRRRRRGRRPGAEEWPPTAGSPPPPPSPRRSSCPSGALVLLSHVLHRTYPWCRHLAQRVRARARERITCPEAERARREVLRRLGVRVASGAKPVRARCEIASSSCDGKRAPRRWRKPPPSPSCAFATGASSDALLNEAPN